MSQSLRDTIRKNVMCLAPHREHSRFTVKRWRRAVARFQTTEGYGQWVADQVVAEFPPEPLAPCTPPPARYPIPLS